VTRLTVVAIVALTIAVPSPASAYSVFAHEANVDALWDTGIRPLLERRYPRATRDQLQDARAYAYGGSVIQDLGYYPFGRFFSNLIADKRYFELLERLADRRFANLPRALHANIAAYYARGARAGMSRSERKRADKIQQWLVAMSR